jgi:ribosomal-protein-alanine N-acetyltransferase
VELKTIETERLILKIANLEDAEFFLKLYNEPKFIQFIGDRNLKTIEDAENYVKEKFQPQFDKMGFGNYVMVTKSDNLKIGAMGIFIREGLEIPDIGFSVLEEFHNFGYAFEAANALKKIIFKDFKIEKLSAITTEDNISSQKLIEKLGLKYIKMVEFPGADNLLRYYEM